MLGLWSAFYALGYIAGLVAFGILAKKRGLDTTGIRVLMCAGLLGGLAGANLTQLVVTGSPGKTLLGAIAFGYLSVVVAKGLTGIRRPTWDLFAVAIAAGEAIGRIGCLIGGCCFGKATHVAWAIWQHHALRHPTQTYLSLSAAATLGVLALLEKKNLPENFLLYAQGTMFCASRFVIEFFRDTSFAWHGLTIAQWACLAGLGFFTYKLCDLNRVKVVRSLAPVLAAAAR